MGLGRIVAATFIGFSLAACAASPKVPISDSIPAKLLKHEVPNFERLNASTMQLIMINIEKLYKNPVVIRSKQKSADGNVQTIYSIDYDEDGVPDVISIFYSDHVDPGEIYLHMADLIWFRHERPAVDESNPLYVKHKDGSFEKYLMDLD